jgi:hypothetical protein
MIDMVTNLNGKNKQVVTFCDIFNNPPMMNMKFGAGAVGAGTGAASRYGSGSSSDQMMRLRPRLRNKLML